MNFNKHYELEGRHAFLSPSKYHWVKYDEDKLVRSFYTSMSAVKGTQLHEMASMMITHGQKAMGNKTTIAMYVNDAIGFRMTPEQPLVYSMNAFGTADAISYRRERRSDDKHTLRIHDLKTGITPASMEQLELYAAFFCLEYGVKPHDINIELRIYQMDEMIPHIPDPDDIHQKMERTVWADRKIDELKAEAARL